MGETHMKKARFVAIALLVAAVMIPTLQAAAQSQKLNVFWFLGFQLQQKPLDDVRVRQAIAHAIDKQKLVALIPGSVLATGIQPPGWKYSVPRTGEPYPYNQDKARELLKAAGVDSLTLEFFAGSNRRKVAASVVQDLAAVNIRPNLHFVNTPAELTGEIKQGQAHLFFFGRGKELSLSDEQAIMVWEFKSDFQPDLYHYRNSGLDALLLQAVQENDAERKKGLFRQAEEMALSDAPVVPLAWSFADLR